MVSDNPNVLQSIIQSISEKLEADIFLFSDAMTEATADQLIAEIRKVEQKNINAVLIITTYGGDPDAAFRIARYFKKKYKKFILFVFGYCKSAGTLLALGADEIVMSDYGELGPLDIQVSQGDEFFRQNSGLDIQQALPLIGSTAFEIFEYYFLQVISRSQANITTKTAADIASSIAVGLISPISAQIDPVRLGEMNRSMTIASAYGQLLNPKGNKDGLKKLVSGYPSHSFVIDYEEAKNIFLNVRETDDLEYSLENIIFSYVRSPQETICCLNKLTEIEGDEENETKHEGNEDGEETDRGSARASGTSIQGSDGENEADQSNSLLSHQSPQND